MCIDSEIDRIIDMDYEELELRVLAKQTCEWCENPGTIWLMHGLYCESCADKFRSLHGSVTTGRPYEPQC